MQSIWVIAGALGLFVLFMAGVGAPWLGAYGVAWLGLVFNSIVNVRSKADAAFSSIEVMLKKRFDLIPSLIDTVSQYMEHESALMTEVTRLRTQGSAVADPGSARECDRMMGPALGKLIATAERYPELKASSSFQELQRALNEVEEQLSAARRAYNMSTKDYNDVIQMFPTSLMAAALRCERREYFETAAAEREPVDVMGRFQSNRDAA